MANDNETPSTFNLGSVDKVPLGQGRCFVVCGKEIAVFRQRDGTLFATQNRCPHKQGPLSEGIIGLGKVVCPLHSHKFDLCNGHGSESGECIEVYSVRDANGEILLSYAGSGQAGEVGTDALKVV